MILKRLPSGNSVPARNPWTSEKKKLRRGRTDLIESLAIWEGQRSLTKGRHQRCQRLHWQHEREKEVQFSFREMESTPYKSRKSPRRVPNTKKLRNRWTPSSTSRPHPTSRTIRSMTTQRPTEKQFGAIRNRERRQKYDGAPKFKRNQNALQRPS